jgi:hypothetical protein
MACRECELADLRWHWGEAYEIIPAGSIFSALRRDGLGSVTALTADGLRSLIREDYMARPVRRAAASPITGQAGGVA